MASRHEIKSNTDTGFLKLIAMACMLVDHLGAIVYPQYPVMRQIGRIAFPLFAYCLTVGCFYTHSIGKYALRVGLLALLVQPLYVTAMKHQAKMAFDWAHNFYRVDLLCRHYLLPYPGILFSLFAGILVIWTIRERQYALTGVLLAICWYLDGYMDYGIKGILLMVLFYALLDRPLASFLWAAMFMCWWGAPSLRTLAGIKSVLSGGALTVYTQFYAVLALPLIYLPLRTGIRVPKYVSYLFYPAHLALIYLLTM